MQENGYGDGFGWKFLVDAALTATRIRSHAREEVQESDRTTSAPRSVLCARREESVPCDSTTRPSRVVALRRIIVNEVAKSSLEMTARHEQVLTTVDFFVCVVQAATPVHPGGTAVVRWLHPFLQ